MMRRNLKLKCTNFPEMSYEQGLSHPLHADGHYVPFPVAARSKSCVCGISLVGL